jgi:hypothetical protein
MVISESVVAIGRTKNGDALPQVADFDSFHCIDLYRFTAFLSPMCAILTTFGGRDSLFREMFGENQLLWASLRPSALLHRNRHLLDDFQAETLPRGNVHGVFDSRRMRRMPKSDRIWPAKANGAQLLLQNIWLATEERINQIYRFADSGVSRGTGPCILAQPLHPESFRQVF